MMMEGERVQGGRESTLARKVDIASMGVGAGKEQLVSIIFTTWCK